VRRRKGTRGIPRARCCLARKYRIRLESSSPNPANRAKRGGGLASKRLKNVTIAHPWGGNAFEVSRKKESKNRRLQPGTGPV